MSLLAFLTGAADATAGEFDKERTRVQEEDQKSLDYRRTILGQMVQGAQEGRLNPEYAARAFKDYFEALQPGGGATKAKGKRGFFGGKEAPADSIFNDLVSGAVQMFGPGTEGRQLNLKMPPMEAKTVPISDPVSGASIPSLTLPTSAESRLQNIRGQLQGQELDKFGGALYANPEVTAFNDQIKQLVGSLDEGSIKALMNVMGQEGIYGGPVPLHQTMQGRFSGRGSNTGKYLTVYIDPQSGERIPTMLLGNQIVRADGSNEPVDISNLVPDPKLRAFVDDYGNIRYMGLEGQVGETRSGGRTTPPAINFNTGQAVTRTGGAPVATDIPGVIPNEKPTEPDYKGAIDTVDKAVADAVETNWRKFGRPNTADYDKNVQAFKDAEIGKIFPGLTYDEAKRRAFMAKPTAVGRGANAGEALTPPPGVPTEGEIDAFLRAEYEKAYGAGAQVDPNNPPPPINSIIGNPDARKDAREELVRRRGSAPLAGRTPNSR